MQAIIAALAAVFGLLAMRPVSSFDFWWHLAMGRATLEFGTPSFPDPTSVAVAETFANFEWLFDVVLYTVHRIGGVPLVQLMVGSLAAASFVLIWKVSAEIVGPRAPWTALTLSTLAAGAAHARFVPRPQSVFLVLLPLTLWLALRLRHSFRSSALALAAVFVVWAQIHASVIIAPTVVLGAMLTECGSHSLGPAWRRLQRRHWVLLGFLSLLVATSAAYGPGIVSLVLDHTDTDVIRHVQGARPFQFSEFGLSPMSVCLLLLLLAGSLGVVHRRRVPLGPLLLLGLGFALAANSVRFLGVLGYLALPLAARSWNCGVEAGLPRGESRTWKLLALLAVVAVPIGAAWRTGAPTLRIYEPNYPVAATDALEALGVEGVLFNAYGDGGYLGWRLYGRSRVVIDGKTQILFNSEEFFAARRGDDEKSAFDALHRTHDFAAVVLPKDRAVCSDLVADPDWSVVWIGERRTVFLPTASAPHDLRRLPACREESHAVAECRRFGGVDEFLAEVETSRRLTPGDAYLARLGAELSLQCSPRGAGGARLDQATAYLRDAASEPDHPDFAFLNAFVLLARGEPEKALVVVEGVTLDHLRSQTLRLRVLAQLGRHQEAAELGQLLAGRHSDHTPPEIRELTAASCEVIDDRRCAVRQALRASLEGFRPSATRLRGYLDRGWVPPEMEALAQGAAR